MSPSYRSMHQHLDMMTMKFTTSIGKARKSLTKHLRRTIWLYKGIGMLKLEGMHRQTEETYVDPHCNAETNERGLRLLEFATSNNLVLTNTLGPNKPSRRWTWHIPDRRHHNQTDYFLVRKINSYQNLTPFININSYQELMSIGQEAVLKQKQNLYHVFIYFCTPVRHGS